MSDTVKLNLAVALQAGAKAAFTAIADGFKQLGKEVKATTKQLSDAGKTDAAYAMGHLGMAIDRVTNSSKEFAKSGKDVRNAANQNSKSLKDYSNELGVVQKAYAKWSDGGKASGDALQVAQRRTDALSKSIHTMGVTMRTGGASWEDINKWKESLNFTNIWKGMKGGELSPTVSGFRDLGKVGMHLLGVNRQLSKSFADAQGFNTRYNAELVKSMNIAPRYGKAVKELGEKFGTTDSKTKAWIPTLNKVQTAMAASEGLIGKSANVMSHWTKTSSLAAITSAVMDKQIRTTSSGFQILSDKGLKAFNGLTVSAADKLGILSKGFDNLSTKVGAQSITAYGKAVNDSIGKTDKFSAGIQALAKKYGVMSASFSSQYEDMKKSDAVWNKHVTTLQKTGKVSTATAEKMREGFNAAKISSQQLTATLSKPNKQYQELEKTINRVSVATGRSTVDLRAQVDALKAQRKPHTEIVNALNSSVGAHKEYSKVQDQIATKTRELAKLRGVSVNKIKEVNDAILSGATTERQLISVANKRNVNLKDQISAQKEVVASTKRMENAKLALIKRYDSELLAHKGFQTAMTTTIKRYGQSAESGKRAAHSLDRFAKQLKDAQVDASLFGKAMANVGKHIKSFASYAVAASFIASLVGSFQQGMVAVIDFDQSLKDLQAITTATDREVEIMGKTILKVASDTKFSASEVAQGMKVLGQAGLSATESIQTIEAVSWLATGTLSEMSTAVDLVTTAMRVFDIQATSSSHIADVLANSVNKSKLTVDKLRIAFNYVGPVAENAGMKFEELISSMMLLANSGMRASTIGTGLRQVINKLVNPPEKLAAAIEKAGYTMDEFSLRTNDLKTVINKLGHVIEDSEDAFKYFGIRGATAVSAITKAGSSGFEEMFAAVSRAGTASEMAGIQMEGLGVKIKNMWDKTKNLAIAVGDTGLAGALGFLVDRIRDVIDFMTVLMGNPITAFLVQMAAATAVVTTLTLSAQLLMRTKLWLWFGTNITAIKGFSGALLLAGGGIKRFMALLGPIGWAILGLSAGYVALKSSMNSFNKSTKKAYDAAKNLSDSYDTLSAKVKNYKKTVAGLDKGSQEFKNANLELRGELHEVGKRLDDLGMYARHAEQDINVLDGTIKEGSTTLEEYFQALKKVNDEASRAAIQAASTAFQETTDRLNGIIHKIGSDVKNLGTIIWSTMKITKDSTLAMFDSSYENAVKRGFVEGEKAASQLAGEVDNVRTAMKEFAEGDMPYEELKAIVEETSVKHSELGKVANQALLGVEEGAITAIAELRRLGSTDMNMTTEALINLAIQEGIVKKGAIDITKAMVYMINKIKEASSSGSSGIADDWLKDLENMKNKYAGFTASISNNDIGMLHDLDSLDSGTILAFEEKQRLIALEMEAIKKKRKENKITVYEEEALKADVNKRAKLLNLEMSKDEDMSRYMKLKAIKKAKDKEIKILEAYEYDATNLTEEQQRTRFKIDQKYAKQRQAAMGRNVEPKKLKEEFTRFSETERTKEKQRILEIERLEARAGGSTVETAKKKADIHTATNAKIMALGKQHYMAMKEQGDIASKDMEAAYKRWQDASQKYFSGETASLKRLNSERRQAEDYETDKIEAEAKQRMVEIQNKAAKREISAGVAAVQIRTEQLKVTDELIKKYTVLHAKYPEDVSYTAKLSELTLEHKELVGETVDTINEQVEATKRLAEAEAKRSAQHEIAMLQGGADNTSSDGAYNNLLKIHSLKMKMANDEVAVAQRLYDEKKSQKALASEMATETLNLQSAIQKRDEMEMASLRALAAERLTVHEEMWRTGQISAAEYQKTIQEAQERGAISYEEGVKRMMASSNDMWASFKHGWKQYGKQMKTQGELMQEFGGTMYEALSEGLADPFAEMASGSKSAKKAFKDFANDVIADLARISMKAALLNLFGAPGANGGRGSLLTFMGIGAAEGGQIPGSSPSPTADDKLIRVTSKEFVEPVSAVNYYGAGVFEAMRKKLIPKELFNTVKSGITESSPMKKPLVRAGNSYAQGGQVNSRTDNNFNVSVPVNVSSESNAQRLSAMLQEGIENTVMSILRREMI